MLRLDASALDYAILAIYFLVVLGIGVVARMSVKTDIDFFLSGRSLPAWITGLAFVAANLGALEILGMAANGAQYGVATVHFYWIGAVPAMVFLGIVMMPFYYGAKVRSVPEYLRLRFNEPTHALNAADLRGGHGAHRRRQPLRARAHRAPVARVVDLDRDHRRRGHRHGLHHARRADLGDLQRGPAVLHHRRLAAAADARRPARHGRMGRPAGQGRGLGAEGGRPARVAGPRDRQRHQPDRRQLDRHRLRPGLRAQLRLLDDELRRGPARAVGQEPVGRAAHAADRRLPEDLHPGADDHSRPRRRSSRSRAWAAATRTCSTTTPSRCSWASTCRRACWGSR